MIWFLRFWGLILIAYFIMIIKSPAKIPTAIANTIRTMFWLEELEEIEEDSFKAWLNRLVSIFMVILLVFGLIKSFSY